MRMAKACFFTLIFFFIQQLGWAQGPYTITIFNSLPIEDENNVILEDGDVIQVIYAKEDGAIDPPLMNIGQPDNGSVSPNDSLLETHVIGEGQAPNTGYFFFSLNIDPSGTHPIQGDYIYLRFFNDSSLPLATYYGDAALYQIPSSSDSYDANVSTDDPLPVQLSSFTTRSLDQAVELNWTTSSELNNQGFEVYRSETENTGFALISSFENNPDLVGAGNSNQERQYHFVDNWVTNGTSYYFKLADVDLNGIRNYSQVVSALPMSGNTGVGNEVEIPEEFTLQPNYPNPFNPETTLRFGLPTLEDGPSRVQIQIYNNLGVLVRTLANKRLLPGWYEVRWDGRADEGQMLTSGIYFAVLRSGTYSMTRKMILLK
ncbi:MAG: T9SS type A sorting domain-containing protein [Calditrichaeota bacterium]|nr:T9SS type A sorting domain-containing protein [Calditrichota bacterium]HQU58158.1 FlgD immunoglobulin-like domain containing protein [Saprospiraceae bacterium]